MTNTERLIENLEQATKHGVNYVHFYVGKFTGNSPAVISALRRRGYVVHSNPGGGYVLKNS